MYVVGLHAAPVYSLRYEAMGSASQQSWTMEGFTLYLRV